MPIDRMKEPERIGGQQDEYPPAQVQLVTCYIRPCTYPWFRTDKKRVTSGLFLLALFVAKRIDRFFAGGLYSWCHPKDDA